MDHRPHPELQVGCLRDVAGEKADALDAAPPEHHCARLSDPVPIQTCVEPAQEELRSVVHGLEWPKTGIQAACLPYPRVDLRRVKALEQQPSA
jgi:hypothetical protein